MNASRAPSAYVSWSHDDDGWSKTVAAFVNALGAHGGVDADFDLLHAHESMDWAACGASAIRSNDFVLIAVSHGYRRMWEEADEPQAASRTASEAGALKAVSGDPALHRKLLIVVLPGASSADIPLELAAARRFHVSSLDPQGLNGLLQVLYGTPAFPRANLDPPHVAPPPPLGDVALLHSDVRREIDDRDGLGKCEAEDVNSIGQSHTYGENAAERFLCELERLVGHRAPRTATLERAARVVAAEEAWREGLGLLLDEEDVARLLGVEHGQVDELAHNEQIIVLEGTDGAPRYPAFQFQDGRVASVLARAHRTLTDSGYVSAWSAAAWARTSHQELNLRTPAQWAGEHRDDETLLLVARRDAARAAQ